MPEARRPSVGDAEDLGFFFKKQHIQQTQVFEPIVELCERCASTEINTIYNEHALVFSHAHAHTE
jgi:hypothetical protein